jgi:hypothetical protein
MNKKAQITVFILLGLVVLLGVGTVFFLQDTGIESAIQVEIPGEVQFAGQQELRTFMDSCIRDAVFNGIELIRLQAGHIYIPEEIPTVAVESDRQIITKNGIKKVIDKKASNKVPYWLDSNNRLFIPTKQYIEDSLAYYIEESILDCVNDFNSFKEQNYQVYTEDINALVSLSDEVYARIGYPITFERDNIRFEESEFILRVPLNLKKAIDIQTEVVLGEFFDSYLESNIKNLISIYSYSGIEKEEYDLPPFSFTDASTSCDMITWKLDEVKQKLIKNLNANSKYFMIRGAGEADLDYDAFTKHVLQEPYEDVETRFELNENDFYLDIKPRSGDSIRPHRHTATGIKLLPLFCNIRYQFKYTLKFPMMVKSKILDAPSININGNTLDNKNNFEISVPVGVFLCGNQNRECTGKPAYVDQKIDIDYEGLGFEPVANTMFCDSDMKLSQTIRLRIIDSYNLSPIKGVSVFYRCSRNDQCLIDVSDENGLIESKFPLCENGQLYIIKKGYSESIKPLSTYMSDETLYLEYPIEPLKELEVEVKLVDLKAFIGNYYLSNGFKVNRCTGENMAVNDATLATIPVSDQNILINSNYGPAQAALLYPGTKTIKLASGDYSFNYLVEGQITVNPSTYDLEGQQETLAVTKDGSSYKGSYLLGNYNDFKASFSDLKNAEKITFYVPVETSSDTIEVKDMTNIIQLDSSLLKSGLIDDDCNPSTPDVEVQITVPKESVWNLLKPRLE